MNPIVINGTVLCDNITGIPRYVYENVVRLDKLIEGTGLDVRIAYRDDGRPIHLPELKNIRLVPLKSIPYFYNLAVLPAYLRRTHAFYVGLASDMLLTRRSVVVLHDIRPLVLDTDKGFFRFKFWVHCLSTKWFAQRQPAAPHQREARHPAGQDRHHLQRLGAHEERHPRREHF